MGMHTATRRVSQVMSAAERSRIEGATVSFFARAISCHPRNEHLFANVLCEVIRAQIPRPSSEHQWRWQLLKHSVNFSPRFALTPCVFAGVLVGGAALSGFTRRLFLQLLLEDERIEVVVRSSSKLYKGTSNALTAVVQHPRCGAGHKYRTLSVCLQTTCAELLNQLAGSLCCFIALHCKSYTNIL